MKFIENTMKNWRADMTAQGKSLADETIQGAIVQELFVIEMMSLRICTDGYKFYKAQKYQLPNVHGWYQTVW